MRKRFTGIIGWNSFFIPPHGRDKMLKMDNDTSYFPAHIVQLPNGALRIDCSGIDGSALWSGFLEVQPDDERYAFWCWIAKRWYPPLSLSGEKLEKAFEQHRQLLKSGKINAAGERLRPAWLRRWIATVERYQQTHWFMQCLLKTALCFLIAAAVILLFDWPLTRTSVLNPLGLLCALCVWAFTLLLFSVDHFLKNR